MGLRVEQDKFEVYQETNTLIMWYLDFTGNHLRWPGIAETFCLSDTKTNNIGRAVEDYECIISDPRISRRHATIEVTDKGLRITDLGSANGTFVNGVQLFGSMTLSIGDQVSFDRIPFRVRRSLNLPDLPLDEIKREANAGFARRRLLQARQERLRVEGRLNMPNLNLEYDNSSTHLKLRSRYAAYKPVMLGSALAVAVAGVIIYLL